MEIIKINDINDLLNEESTTFKEGASHKAILENYIKTYFAPNIDLKLDTIYNLAVEGKRHGIVLDEMALLMPLARILDMKLDNKNSEDDKLFIKAHIVERLSELKRITIKENLIIKFPTLFGLFQAREEEIQRSVQLHCECKRIIPASEAEKIIYIKCNEYGISRATHEALLKQAPTFNLKSFICAYVSDLERIANNLDFLINTIRAAVIPGDGIATLDETEIKNLMHSKKQKQRGLK